VGQRRFFGEIARLLDKSVMVIMMDGKKYSGTLVGINPATLTLCLSEAKDASGAYMDKVFLNGSVIAQIFTVEKPFALKALAERLEKVFPTMVKLYEQKGFIWVMDKIQVTEKGVVEGSGPAAERVQKVYDLFMKDALSK
jgi:small nuclear ribonucleoprotein (snRNP)-like protein